MAVSKDQPLTDAEWIRLECEVARIKEEMHLDPWDEFLTTVLWVLATIGAFCTFLFLCGIYGYYKG